MTGINVGEIKIDIAADSSPFRSQMRFVDKLASVSARKTSKEYNVNFEQGISRSRAGFILNDRVVKGFKTKQLAKSKSAEFTSNFNAGTKGLFKGVNFSALSFGLNVATLAFRAIADEIERAKQRQAQYMQELNEFNDVAKRSEEFLAHIAVLENDAGAAARLAAGGVDELTAKYVTLADTIQGVVNNQINELVNAEMAGNADLFDQVRELETQRRKILERSQNRASGENSPFEKEERAELARRIGMLNKLRAQSLKRQQDIAGSMDELKGKENARYELIQKRITQTDRLAVAQASNDKKTVNAIQDEILLNAKLAEFKGAKFDDYEARAAKFVKDIQDARKEGELSELQEKALAKATRDATKAAFERSKQIAEANRLYKESRTPIEEYADRLKHLATIQSDQELAGKAGGGETFNRLAVKALEKLARQTKDVNLVNDEFVKLLAAGNVSTSERVGIQKQLNDALGVTAKREADLKKLEKEKDANKKQALTLKKIRDDQKQYLEDLRQEHAINVAALAGNDKRLADLEREYEIKRRIRDLEERGGLSNQAATTQATREVSELEVASARGVFRDGFSDGLRAALDGDLGSYLENKLKDLGSGMFDRAIENLADAVFDQLSQIAPGFLGQITGNTNLPSALSGATGAAGQAATSVATQAATGAAAQTAQTTATATAVTTAMTAGGTTAATAIGTAMTTAGTAVAGQIAAAMASGGATSGLSSFAGAFATGGVIGSGKFGLVGENGPELVSAGSGPIRITPLESGRLNAFSTNGLESRGSNQSAPSNVVMNISGVKDLGSFVKSQGTIEADMAAAVRRAQSDF